MAVGLAGFDPAKYLTEPEDQAELLADALQRVTCPPKDPSF
jgi:hypothetical protein